MKNWTSLGVKKEEKKIAMKAWKTHRQKKETIGEYVVRIIQQVNAEEIQ